MATVISQTAAMPLLGRALCTNEGTVRLNLREIKIYGEQTKQILRIGLPASFQGIVFSFSNVLIQSSINSFGSVVVAGSAAAVNTLWVTLILPNTISLTIVNIFHRRIKNITLYIQE